MTQDEANALADARYEEIAPLYKQINNERFELDESDIAQWKIDYANNLLWEANEKWEEDRKNAYPPVSEFLEAYTEKEILGESTKWNEYVEKYNQVKTDYPKPE